jgi:hypothetical protein
VHYQASGDGDLAIYRAGATKPERLLGWCATPTIDCKVRIGGRGEAKIWIATMTDGVKEFVGGSEVAEEVD